MTEQNQSSDEAAAKKKKKVTKSKSADESLTSMQKVKDTEDGAVQTTSLTDGDDEKKLSKEKSSRKLLKSESSSRKLVKSESSSSSRKLLRQESKRLTKQESSRKDKKHSIKGAAEAMQGGTKTEDKASTDDNSSDKKSMKKDKKKRKKKKTTSSALTKLQDALDDLNPHVTRSKGADKVLRNIDKAVVQLEKQWKEWTENPPELQDAMPEQLLNVKYLLTVDEDTPEIDPFDNMTLHRATYAANDPSEDRSTVVVGEDFIFAGVWDGHGGTHAAEFSQQHLFDYFQEAYESKGFNITQSFQFAYTQTDRAYFEYARQINKPNVFFAGTCAVGCFVDIKTGKVTCANLGDSRAVMGLYKEDGEKVKTVPLSVDHSAGNLLEQTRIRQEHPNDRDILVNDGDKEDPDWRVKKLAAFTRSIGDLHMKEKNTAALFNSYVKPELRILPRPGLKDKQGVIKPKYISTEPDFQEGIIKNGFIVIACDGVWDEMSSEEAVNIVAWLLSKHDPAERNIAELFIEETLKRAVRRIAGTYEEEANLTLAELKKRPPGKGGDTHRSYLHDDITVVILQFGKTTHRQAFGGSLFSMLQQADAEASPSTLSECDRSRMSRTKEKREMAARNSITKYAEEIDNLQADAQRQATDRQIIEMMLAFEDLQARHLRILFNAVDVDGNGTLDREEITRLIKYVIDMDVSDEVVDLAFSEMDADGSGDVDFEEFVQFFGH